MGNGGAIDVYKAQTVACSGSGNTNMEGSVFPADIGYLHHEPVAEIIRQCKAVAVPQISATWQALAGERSAGEPGLGEWGVVGGREGVAGFVVDGQGS